MLEDSNNTIINLGITCNSQFCLLSPKVFEIEANIQYAPVCLDIMHSLANDGAYIFFCHFLPSIVLCVNIAGRV
jgi:hypothetical protein